MAPFLTLLWLPALLICRPTCAMPDPLDPATPLGPARIAITVDDLPGNGALIPGKTRIDIARAVLQALKDNGVPQAFGFANGRDIAVEPGLLEVLKEWLKANYPVGNHTYSHLDLNVTTAQEFIADIEKLDHMLDALASFAPLLEHSLMFRYPYLDEGNTLEKRDTVRGYLSRRGYRIAEVTIDYYDWAWNAAYVRCIDQHDPKSIAWLEAHAVDNTERHLRGSKGMSELLFGRNIPQILLVHDSAFEALMLNLILKDLRAKGVSFITLDRALSDPVYGINPDRAFDRGLTFLEQLAAARKLDYERFVDTKYTLERLSQVCKANPEAR